MGDNRKKIVIIQVDNVLVPGELRTKIAKKYEDKVGSDIIVCGQLYNEYTSKKIGKTFKKSFGSPTFFLNKPSCFKEIIENLLQKDVTIVISTLWNYYSILPELLNQICDLPQFSQEKIIFAANGTKLQVAQIVQKLVNPKNEGTDYSNIGIFGDNNGTTSILTGKGATLLDVNKINPNNFRFENFTELNDFIHITGDIEQETT